jgi:hypothetical protein
MHNISALMTSEPVHRVIAMDSSEWVVLRLSL